MKDDQARNLDKKIVKKYYNEAAPETQEPDFYVAQKAKRRQKIALISLGVITVGVIAVGILQMRGVLSVPFPHTGKETTVAQVTKSDALDLSQVDENILKGQDTDEDGLTDFEELYIYNTSPYLADSDSDDDSDYDEIINHEDPNCPKGQACFMSVDVDVEIELPVQTGSDITVAQLRQLLISAGYSQEQIDLLEDKDLLDIYNAALAENPDLQLQLEQSSGSTASDETSVEVDPYDVTPAQVRQLLSEQGFTNEEISLFDDATLMNLYEQALDSSSEVSE